MFPGNGSPYEHETPVVKKVPHGQPLSRAQGPHGICPLVSLWGGPARGVFVGSGRSSLPRGGIFSIAFG